MSFEKSKHNIVSRVGNTNQWLIANPLSGQADFLSADEFAKYEQGIFPDEAAFAKRGYLVDPAEENRRFNEAYANFLDERESDELQLFFVPDYGCNFACDYCYQVAYAQHAHEEALTVVDAFFAYVDKQFKGRRKYLTLFGGEPLVASNNRKALVAHFLDQAKSRGLETAIVTNGYQISQFMDILNNALIREVQVTLDGLKTVHDQRRPLKGGGSTFDQIVAGIDQLLENQIPVNLRMVIDKENIDELPGLARFAIDRGWTKRPTFKTQLGRNYELHTCQAQQSKLYSRLAMYTDLAQIIEAHPHVREFHAPSFHFVKSLAEEAQMPAPIFDSCPGTKTEWAFDYTGHIYACTATVGKQGESLGQFYPQITLDDDQIEAWQDRDVLAIEKCRTCPLALTCGGGCGSVAKNKNGELHSPDCRPVDQIVQVGAPLYFKPGQTS